MKLLKQLTIAVGIIFLSACTSQQYIDRVEKKAKKKFDRLVEAHPNLLVIDTNETVNTAAVEVKVEPEREVTNAKIDTFIHIICDTLTPPAVKEKARRELMQNATIEGLYGSDTIRLISPDGVEVALVAKGNKQKIINKIKTVTIKSAVVLQPSYAQKALDTWHVPAAAVGLVLFLIVWRKAIS